MKKPHLLLLNPPSNLDAILGIGSTFVQKYEPLGLLYIAAVSQKAGYPTTVIDANAEEITPAEIKQRITQIDPEIIGITTVTSNGAIVFDLGQWLTNTFPKKLVILGNIHASVYAKTFLENRCCDIVVHGEGEHTIVKILAAYTHATTWEAIPSISFRDAKGSLVKTSAGDEIEDISSLPMPARELVDSQLYSLNTISNQTFIPTNKHSVRSMITSRGCPFRCIFCVVHGKKKQRFNSAEQVVAEMELLHTKYSAAYINIMDSLFMADTDRLITICELIRQKDLSFSWGCDAHVAFITPEVVSHMERAGCVALDFGIESGCPRLLDIVRKGTQLSQIRNALNTVKEHSAIKTTGLFILGLPTETYAETVQTINFAKSLPLDMAQFSILTPYPGSALFESLLDTNELPIGLDPDGTVDPTLWNRFSAYITFTTNDPIWTTHTLSPTILRKLQKKAQREFYLRPKQIMTQIKRIRPNNVITAVRIALKGFF